MKIFNIFLITKLTNDIKNNIIFFMIKNVVQEKNIDDVEETKVRLPKDANDLVVITRAKDLVKYVVVVTAKSPKHFRHTIVARILNLAFDVVDNLYR